MELERFVASYRCGVLVELLRCEVNVRRESVGGIGANDVDGQARVGLSEVLVGFLNLARDLLEELAQLAVVHLDT
ncbi:hypothetical protein [Curtobacterium sp. MCBD17_030]|uniref:hypothetical protein n=1 Tax=Curtobacterium sp. MCBD17_030 TaxID=2175649 RepID=UPI000D835469|nr:hypothetical protein [Curtobacterium sp. MCBD17_030]PYY31529.1 hypothetical protein DEI89_16920 [Curtobacterium sp. MCBD17_030]